MSTKVHAFGGNDLVVVELDLPIKKRMYLHASEELKALGEIDPSMEKALKHLLCRLDPRSSSGPINRGKASQNELEITRLQRVVLHSSWMQVDYTVLQPDVSGEPKEVVKRSIQLKYDWLDDLAVLPIARDGRIVLVQTFEHGVRGSRLHLPRGVMDVLDTHPFCARRIAGSLLGYSGRDDDQVHDLGVAEPDPEILATSIQMLAVMNVPIDESKLNVAATGVAQKILAFTPDEVKELVRSGRITDSVTLAALYKASLQGLIG